LLVKFESLTEYTVTTVFRLIASCEVDCWEGRQRLHWTERCKESHAVDSSHDGWSWGSCQLSTLCGW